MRIWSNIITKSLTINLQNVVSRIPNAIINMSHCHLTVPERYASVNERVRTLASRVDIVALVSIPLGHALMDARYRRGCHILTIAPVHVEPSFEDIYGK